MHVFSIQAIRTAYLSYFSQPRHERALYRRIRKQRVRSIVEIGVGSAIRAQRMIAVAVGRASPSDVRYTGVDQFELRQDAATGLPLKAVHRRLAATGARIRLAPGDAYSALARSANVIGPVDLIVIAADQQGPDLDRAWFYLPRMMSDATVVLQELVGDGESLSFETLAREEILERANPGRRRRAA